MTQVFKQRVDAQLAEREAKGLTRQLQLMLGGNQVEAEVNGRRFLNFSSNDYLGLASDSELVNYWQKGLSIYGCGSAASPMVTGFSPAHQNLQAALCDWLGYECAILFSSGFSANQALLFSMLQKGDRLLQDKLNHASLIEAGMLSDADMRRFRHNDLHHLQKLLTNEQPNFIVTEGVFSMDGDRAPLAELLSIAGDNSMVAVDDAHGIGVLGDDGNGSCGELKTKPHFLVVTFGKSLGMSGAAVLCNQPFGRYIEQFARHHVYSTAIPPAQAFALKHALHMIQTQHWRRERLHELQDAYRHYLDGYSQYVDTVTPIKPFVVGSSEETIKVSQKMKEHGIWLTGIRPPTVPEGGARLRITLTANHTVQQVKILCDTLKHVIEMTG